MSDELEFRSVAGVEVRADEEGTPTSLLVTFARFNVWTHIRSWEGEFLERLVPGAFEATFAERGPQGSGMIRSLFNHGRDPSIGSKILGQVVDLRETATGPVGQVDLLRYEGNVVDYVRDIAAGVAAGGYGASYRFGPRRSGGVDGESWNKRPEPRADNPRGLPERTLTAVNVSEFGPVTFPADEGTNDAGLVTVRSLETYFADNPNGPPAILPADVRGTGEGSGVEGGGESEARARAEGHAARLRRLRV